MKRSACLALLAAALLVAPASAAGPRLTATAGAKFPDRSYVLTLPSRVALNASQVSVTENGVPVNGVTVQAAKAVGQRSFGTVLLIETSASMRGRPIQAAMAAARAFAAHRDPQQPLGVIMFGSDYRVALPLTTDPAAINTALSGVPQLTTGTHVFNAVQAGLQMLSSAGTTAGALVVLSDGAQTGVLSARAGQQRKAQVISGAVAQQARVYTIGIHDGAFNARTLQNLASATTGTYTAVSSNGLTQFLRQLGTELSNQYLIRYRSLAPLGSNVNVAVRIAGQPGQALSSYATPALPPPAAAGPRVMHKSFWHTTLSVVLASVACALLVGFAVLALLSPRRGVRSRVSRFVSTSRLPRKKKSWTNAMLERAFADDVGATRSRRWAGLSEDVDLAQIGMSTNQIVALTAIATLILGWLLVIETGSALGAFVALCIPISVRVAIRVQVDRQRRAFDEQLPDNLQVVASAMRAGHTFVSALAVVAEDAPEPSRRELKRVLADEQLGIPLVDALNRVTERMKSRDFEHVALVAALQRETGGNTAEVIDSVTETIRERLDLRRLVRTLTAQGRLSGWVVSALPPALLLLISLINPAYIHPLFHRTAGIIGLCLGAAMVGTGFFLIRRIVDIEV